MAEDLQKLITNTTVLLQRAKLAGLAGKAFDGSRDYYSTFGWKEDLTYQDYRDKYNRQDIAGRIIDAPADETWRTPPEIVEVRDEDGDKVSEEEMTTFETAWDELSSRLRIWHYFNRVDKRSHIGHYGVIVLGTRDSSNLEQPLEQLKSVDDLLYLTVLGEGRADISEIVDDKEDERYGKPLMYDIDFQGNLFFEDDEDDNSTERVHYTRIIHIADNLEEDDLLGRPALQRVFNLLDDLYKVAGGAPEMFWQNARKGVHADIRDEYNPESGDLEDLRDELDEFYNGLRRYIRSQGVDIKDLGVDVANPEPTFKILIQLLSSATAIPARILLGSERGELASSQDEKNWLSQIETRQTNFAEPMMIRPFIDRLIELGALPEVEYEVKWENLFKLDEKEEAEMLKVKIEAANELMLGGASNVLDVQAILEDKLNLTVADDIEEIPLDEDDEEVQSQFEEGQNE